MSKMSDNINEANKELKSQQDLLRESADISQSSLDSLKEALGIQQRRTTAESDLLKVGNEINKTIQNQQTGLEDITSLQNQIEKNQKAISKATNEEQGLLESIGGKLSEKGKYTQKLISDYAKSTSQIDAMSAALSAGKAIDESKLKVLQQQAANQAANLDTAYKSLSPLEKQYISISNQNKALQDQTKLREGELKKEKDIEKRLGVAGGLLKGISKIPILGDIVNANSALGEMEKELRDGGNAMGALSKGMKNIGGQIMSELKNPMTLALSIFTSMIKSLTAADKRAGEYAKSMNMTYEEAQNTSMEMSKIANLSGDTALTSAKLMKTSQQVGTALGTNAQLNEEDLKTMTKLTNQAGFQADELMNIQKLSLAQGKSLKANTKEILGGAAAYARKNKIAVNEKTILKEVNNMSASLKLSLGGSGDAMARSAVEAKKFGINLQQAEKISSSLLDFESSIQNELEAELLTGKDLNFEKARSLALSGDAAGAAKEILSQAQSLTEEQLKNPIIMGSMAKAAGMTREELAASIIESKALKNIGVESVEEAQKEYEILKEKYGAEKAAKMLGDEALASQFEQQDIQEQMADSSAKMQEIFIMMTPALVMIGDALNAVFEVIGLIMIPVQLLSDLFSSIGKKISNLIGPLGKVGKILKGVASLAVVYAAYKAYASLATLPIVGVPMGIAAAAAVTAMGMGAISQIKDGVIDPKGGIMMSGEKGSIQLDKDDSVVAGTNLFGGKKGGSSQKPQSQGNIDMTPVINAINALASRPINVQVGEDVIIKAAVGNDPKVTGDEMGKNSYQLN